jgi:hypothetical protein
VRDFKQTACGSGNKIKLQMGSTYYTELYTHREGVGWGGRTSCTDRLILSLKLITTAAEGFDSHPSSLEWAGVFLSERLYCGLDDRVVGFRFQIITRYIFFRASRSVLGPTQPPT